MRRYLPFVFEAAGGVICLPATYSLTRQGSISLSLLEVFAIGAAAGIAAHAIRKDRVVLLPVASAIAFVSGVVVSEILSFANYYFVTGIADPKLGVGIDLAILEAAVISAIGVTAMAIAERISSAHANRSA